MSEDEQNGGWETTPEELKGENKRLRTALLMISGRDASIELPWLRRIVDEALNHPPPVQEKRHTMKRDVGELPWWVTMTTPRFVCQHESDGHRCGSEVFEAVAWPMCHGKAMTFTSAPRR